MFTMSKFLMAAALLAAASLHAADNQLTPQERAAGWTNLFDGTTYTHWVDPTRKSPPQTSFTIEDDCLKSTPHPTIDAALSREDTFAHFALESHWKISTP